MFKKLLAVALVLAVVDESVKGKMKKYIVKDM